MYDEVDRLRFVGRGRIYTKVVDKRGWVADGEGGRG